VDNADAPFDLRLGRESLPPFAHRFEKNGLSSWSLVNMAHLPFMEWVEEGDTGREGKVRDSRFFVDFQTLLRLVP
jgi:hypothetical protein